MAKVTGVYRRGDQWWIRYTAVDPRDGRRKQLREWGGETFDAARDTLADRQEAARQGTLIHRPKKDSLTLKQLSERWLSRAEAEGKRSLAADRQRWAVILDLLGEERRLADLTNENLVRFRASLLKAKTRRGGTTSQATANRVIALFRASVRACAEGERVQITRWPMAREAPRAQTFTPAEIAKLVGAAEAKGWRNLTLAIRLASTYPIRLGSIASIRWEQVDLEAATIRLDGTQTKDGEPLTIELIPATVKLLEVWRAERDAEIAARKKSKSKSKGYPAQLFGLKSPGTQTLSPQFGRLCRDLGFTGRRFHDLKRTTITKLLAAGANIADASALSGTTVQTLSKHYVGSGDRRRELIALAALAVPAAPKRRRK